MRAYEQFNLILCIIVFIALTLLFSALITVIVRLTLKTIHAGVDDEKIKKEYLQEQKRKKRHRLVTILSSTFPILLCAILACGLGVSLYSRISQNAKVGAIPTLKVVETGSMETKNKENGYLFDNNLNDQLATFDLVVLHQLPKEEDLKLYDIVVYEVNGYFIIHRIVAIEEPNEKHPNERWFVLRGDANIYADDYPVTYDQMRSIYRGQSIPQVGMFVIFMQSPAGMLCLLLVLLAVITTPIVEHIIEKAVRNRLLAIGLLSDGKEEIAATQDPMEAVVEEPTKVEEKSLVEEEPLAQEVITLMEEKACVEEGEADSDKFGKFKNRKTFVEKLSGINEQRAEWYRQFRDALMQQPSIKRTQAKYHELYKKGNKGIAKITIKGKSVYVYLAVDPAEYAQPKYGIKDASSKKAYVNYPAECKMTSNRKVKYLIEIVQKGNKPSEEIMEENPVEEIPMEQEEAQPFDRFGKFGDRKPFEEKLKGLREERAAWYRQLSEALMQVTAVKKTKAKYHELYKKGNKGIAKITIKGKSVYVYLGVDPAEYAQPKYGIKDASSKKAYVNYPAECKITSNRKVKYLLEIIKNL